MDTTLGIAVVALLLSLLLVAGTLVVLGLAILAFVRATRQRARRAQVAQWAARAQAQDDEQSTMLPRQGGAFDPSLVRAEPTAEISKPEPLTPALASGGLIGFFDDEPSVTGIEVARTELFQRGKLAVDWDDDDEQEYEATEIFSAHGAAGDLAEFAFEDADEQTGRFR